jgi:helicase
LGIVKTALIVRAWTRAGCTGTVADAFDCYPFEVRRLSESVERILTAAVAVLTPPKEKVSATDESSREVAIDSGPPLPERVRALAAMVTHGVDEQVVTLTYLHGIGGTLARRLSDAGITDVEELALAETEALAAVRGVSAARATRWIDEAAEKIRFRPAFSLRETGRAAETSRESWNSIVDPYRLRRALDLTVRQHGNEFTVTGGLEPHRVTQVKGRLGCDCADFVQGRECKHVLAVRMHGKDADLLSSMQRPSSRMTSGLDLFHLWFDQGRQ